MRNNKGFTLIELVVVIVILGILAATAAPKFMDLQKDAKTSAIHGLQGAVKSAANMAYAKSIIQGSDKIEDYGGTGKTCETADDSSDIVCTVYGYPQAAKDGIIKAMQDEDSFVSKSAGVACETNTEWCYYTLKSDSTSSKLFISKLFISPKSSVGLEASGDFSKSCGLLYEVKVDSTNKTSSINVSVKSESC